jgi:hypothetical protein
MIPDGIEPIRGLRQWNSLKTRWGTQLTSVTSSERWVPNRVSEATCRNTFIIPPQPTSLVYPAGGGRWKSRHWNPWDQKHEVPGEHCMCGFWSVAHPADAFDPSGELWVMGVIEMWGRVLEGEKGWRAQFARVAGMVKGHEDAPAAARTYEVPLFKTWEEALSGHRQDTEDNFHRADSGTERNANRGAFARFFARARA